jgi:hypothetical protein
MSRVMSTFGQLSKISSPPTILQAGELLCQREMESSERIANFSHRCRQGIGNSMAFPRDKLVDIAEKPDAVKA